MNKADAEEHGSGRGLTAVEAAARLGVKRQTLYAYVSRGMLNREVAPDGRTSLFDPAEIDRLVKGRRPESEGELNTLITSALTFVDDQGLLIRGRDLIEAVTGGSKFTDVVDLLWDTPDGESWELPGGSAAPNDGLPTPAPLTPTVPTAPRSLLDQLRIVVARGSAADPLRHDLSPKSIRAVGRRMISNQVTVLEPLGDGSDATMASSLWRRLTPAEPDPAKLAALDTAMALLVDHGLAGSTFAARIAASVRADPYSVVITGLGVMGGPLHGAASGSVHELLVETERSGDAATAAGAVRRRIGMFPGFGHSVYTIQDPRYGALMAAIIDAWGNDPRLVNVYRIRDIIGERTDAIPNVDFALGSLTYLANMTEDSGEVIFAIARTAGWLAHAMEEYEEKPLRFRPRARYIGNRPG